MIDECNMCHPQMKAPTFATLQRNFMRNFESKMPDLDLKCASLGKSVWQLSKEGTLMYFLSITDYP